MSEVQLKLKHAPRLRVDLRGLLPSALATQSARGIAQFRVWHGNEPLPIGELFDIAVRSNDTEPTLRLEGDLTRFDHLGRGMEGGRIEVVGNVGDYAGAQMSGGSLRIGGDAGMFAACEMRGGALDVEGNVGHFAASALPGSMDGMRGGSLTVRGSAGERLGDRMRRGTVIVHGDVGDYAASRMVAGTIAVAGAVGTHPAFGMRRGTLLLLRARPALPPTFVATGHDIAVFWQLLARSLQRAGGAFADLPTRRPQRLAGDLAVEGKGEVLLCG
jgi:formylmethanofuran dehydrogenase subunit C